MSRYSVTQKGDSHYITFEKKPPKPVLQQLQAKGCAWQAYQRNWKCKTSALKGVKAVLKKANWSQAAEVVAERVALTAAVVPHGDDLILQFNRAPDDEVVADLRHLAASPNEDDKREWVIVGSKHAAVRALLRQHNVGVAKPRRVKGAPTVAPAEQWDANMRVHTRRITLSFPDGLPSVNGLLQLKGALQRGGVTLKTIKGAPGVELPDLTAPLPQEEQQ